jgi:hypothetical protein
MSPTKVYVLFWIGIMTVFLLVSGGLGWLLWKNYGVLVQIRDLLKK